LVTAFDLVRLLLDAPFEAWRFSVWASLSIAAGCFRLKRRLSAGGYGLFHWLAGLGGRSDRRLYRVF